MRKDATTGAIRGLVIPDHWNSDGKIVAITIQTNQEEIFLVEHNEASRKLLAFVHEEVEVSGKLTERINGTTLLTVKKFRPVAMAEDRVPN